MPGHRARTARGPDENRDSYGADLDAFCDGFPELTSAANEVIGYGTTKDIDRASRADLDAAFVASAARANVSRYGT